MEWYQILFGVIVGLLCLMFLIIVHELGHAIVARRNGVEVEEFGIGFPPRAKVLGKYKGTLVTLNWLLPIGGFCKMKGESDADTEQGSYGAASYWSKTKILFAGVTMNLITAVVIFTILAITGLPKVMENQFSMPGDATVISSPVTVSAVSESSPAESAGIVVGDEIISLDGQDVRSATELPELAKNNCGKKLTVELRRGGETLKKDITLGNKPEVGCLGVSVGQSEYTRSTWSAPIVGVAVTGQFAWLTLDGLGQLATNFFGGLIGLLSLNDNAREAASSSLSAAGDNVAGPVGILGVIFPSALDGGLTQLAFIVGIISLTLAIMNVLPIPSLDGGRWLLTTIFKIIRKPLSRDLEATINGIGMLILFGLVILITVVDLAKIW